MSAAPRLLPVRVGGTAGHHFLGIAQSAADRGHWWRDLSRDTLHWQLPLRSGCNLLLHHACRCARLSSKPQIQRQWRILQRLESDMYVEGLGHIALRNHNQCVRCNLLSSLQAAIDGAVQ
jgi:hypothetical protein